MLSGADQIKSDYIDTVAVIVQTSLKSSKCVRTHASLKLEFFDILSLIIFVFESLSKSNGF